MAFTDGETCVAIIADKDDGGEKGDGRSIRVSFSVRTPLPKGQWAGVLELSDAGFQALNDLVDQANDYLESQDEDEE